MTTERRLERDLPFILGDLAMGPYPDYIDDVLASTAQRRQRPAWTFPERWLPMDLVTTRVAAPRLPWRQLGILAILAALVATGAAIFAASGQRVPAPFGLAANGHVAYADNGDIYTADPLTGAATAIVVGPETDARPTWSLDGTRVVFERKVKGNSGPGLLFVTDADGGGLVQVTPEPMAGLAEWGFSPDGRSIVALALGERGLAIMVIASDGSGTPALFDVEATSDDGPPRYRPDGSEIMFIGRPAGAVTRGIYALDPISGHVRTVIAASSSADIHGAAWSPDGSRIAYGTLDPTSPSTTARTHVVSADGTGDIAVDTHPEPIADFGNVWSNDGTRLIIARIYLIDGSEILRIAVVPIDRSSVGVELDCPPGASQDDCTADWIWSPDDSVLLGARPDGAQILADPLTGDIRSTPWTATGYPAWQRVAP